MLARALQLLESDSVRGAMRSKIKTLFSALHCIWRRYTKRPEKSIKLQHWLTYISDIWWFWFWGDLDNTRAFRRSRQQTKQTVS